MQEQMAIDTPLVVMTDEGTYAGAEVVAGALKDLDRALIVGRRTFGAGTVQVAYDFGPMQTVGRIALSLTIAFLVRPSGLEIDRAGVVPDVRILRRAAGEDAGVEERPARLRLQLRNPFATPVLPLAVTKEQPVAEVSYDWRPAAGHPGLESQLLEDVEIRLSKELLERVGARRRSEMLPKVNGVVAGWR